MLKDSKAFSGFAVDDLNKAETFYKEVLGLETELDAMGLRIRLGSGADVFAYQKDNHEPASFTILNFPVDNIESAVNALTTKGVTFEHYDSGMIKTDDKGIARGKASGMGPDIAWFKDPAGNILSVLQE